MSRNGKIEDFVSMFLAKVTIVILIKLPPDNEKYASQKKRCTFFVPDSLQKLGLLTVPETKKVRTTVQTFRSK